MILCAALKIESENLNTVIPCVRHANGYEILHDFMIKHTEVKITEGFIDTNNNFYSRHAAYNEALLCGQLSAQVRHYKSENKEFELYSEDLY